MRYVIAIQHWQPDLREDGGQTMAEYAVILAVVAIGVIVAITALSGGIGNAIDKVTDILPKP
jgi:Flp pilus assembly pilin Flp